MLTRTLWDRFDVRGLGGQPKDEDTEGMLASVSTIKELIAAEEQASIASERVVVGGFSQGESSYREGRIGGQRRLLMLKIGFGTGGVLSLLTGLTLEKKLAGVLCLSGYLGLTHEDRIDAVSFVLAPARPKSAMADSRRSLSFVAPSSSAAAAHLEDYTLLLGPRRGGSDDQVRFFLLLPTPIQFEDLSSTSMLESLGARLALADPPCSLQVRQSPTRPPAPS